MTLEMLQYLADPKAGSPDWTKMSYAEIECRFEWQLAIEDWLAWLCFNGFVG